MTTLHDIQTTVHVAKNKRNDFGGYNYRTAEGILAALKAALPDGATVIVSDDLKEVAGRIFVSATATIRLADGAEYSATGHAMHALQKKGMDDAQITGSASSYARKYALAGLLALDDGSADPDAGRHDEEPEPQQKPQAQPKLTSEQLRDKMKTALSNAESLKALSGIWENPAFKADFAKLAAPHQGEITKLHTDRMGELS